MQTIGFLAIPPTTAEAQRTFDEDIAENGYVMNFSQLWAYQPTMTAGLLTMARAASAEANLSLRERFIIVTACAATFGDRYCSLVWGNMLAEASDPQTAAAVLRGTDDGLDDRERALARWARTLARDPHATSAADVQALRDARFTDSQIFSMTVFIALRLALSAVTDALGVLPDSALRSTLPGIVLDAAPLGRRA